jgi:hypothetical protein
MIMSLHQVSSQRYPKEEHHMTLAAFFSGELSAQFPERNIDPMPLFFHSEISSEDGSGPDVGSSPSSQFYMPNRQKLHELPYALRMSGQEVELTKLLTDLNYISAIFFAGENSQPLLRVCGATGILWTNQIEPLTHCQIPDCANFATSQGALSRQT